MPPTLPARDGARPRFRGAITTALVILLAVMIVRDVFARRWGSARLPSSDATRGIP